MSTSPYETMPAPTLPPPATAPASDLPTPSPTPLTAPDAPQLAAAPPPPPAAAEQPPVTLLLPGSEAELPRLGEPGVVAPLPAVTVEPTFEVSEVQGSDAPVLPSLPTAQPHAAPTQVTAPEPATPDDTAPAATPDTDEDEPVQRDHPMAHLMGTTAPATEASKRAAEVRAEMRKRSKRVKLAVIAGFIAATAAAVIYVGPWLVDAVNEAGNTTDEPAIETVEQP